MFECYRCRKMTQAGDRWTHFIHDMGDVMVSDGTNYLPITPVTEERYYHKQCVPLNLARTENNYTPG